MTPHERMTEQDLQIILARQQKLPTDNHEADPGPESELHSKITKNCRQRGWPYLYLPQTPELKKWIPPGWPDDTIIMPYTNVLFLEGKARKGRFSDDQKLLRSMFHYLGHTIHEIRSWKRYVEITEGILRRK